MCVAAERALPCQTSAAGTLPLSRVWFCCHLSTGTSGKGPCGGWRPWHQGAGTPFPKSLKAVALWRPPGPTLLFSPNYTVNSLLLELARFGVGLQGDEGCPASFLFQPRPHVHSPARVQWVC